MKRLRPILMLASLLLAAAVVVMVGRWWAGPTIDLPPGIAAPDAATAERIVFFAVGRQGYENPESRAIAAAMERLAADDPPHFVALAGDNFYPAGPTSIRDAKWVTSFEELYDGPHLVGTPFFAVPGNHDRRGDIDAQFAYGREQRGSGRWTMDGHHYARTFGTRDGRALLRVVFVDTDDLRYGDTDAARKQISQLLRPAGSNPLWTIIVGHYPLRSLTENPLSQSNILQDFRDLFATADLYLSANDRFQQVIELPDEPLHVSVNGGGDKQEDLTPRDEPGKFVAARPGFGKIVVDAQTMTVELYDEHELKAHRVQISR